MLQSHRFERSIDIYENERLWIGRGFSQAGLLPTDRVGPFSTRDGSLSWKTLDEAIESLLLRRQGGGNVGEGGSDNIDDKNDNLGKDTPETMHRRHRGRGWSFHDAEESNSHTHTINDESDEPYHKSAKHNCKEQTFNADEDYYIGFDGSKSSTRRIIFTKDFLYHGFVPCIVDSEAGDVTVHGIIPDGVYNIESSSPTDLDGWQYFPVRSKNELRTPNTSDIFLTMILFRGILDFVRRRKLSRIAVFRPDHFVPKEVYAKCDFCDSKAVNMLSSAMLDSLALAALFAHGSTDRISDAQALELKCKLIDALSIGDNCGYDNAREVGLGVGDNSVRVHNNDFNYNPRVDVDRIKDRLCTFAETCVGKQHHGLLVLQPENDVQQNIVTYIPTMRRVMSRYLGEHERVILAQLLIKDIDRHSYEMHCSTDYCSQHGTNIDDMCKFRIVTCHNEGCDATFSFIHQIQHDEEDCQHIILPCPNDCGVGVRRKDIEIHVREECSLRPVTCPLCEIGCNDSVRARDVNQHLNDTTARHFRLIVRSLLENQNEMKCMKDYIRTLEEKNSRLEKNVETMLSETRTITKRLASLETTCRTESGIMVEHRRRNRRE